MEDKTKEKIINFIKKILKYKQEPLSINIKVRRTPEPKLLVINRTQPSQFYGGNLQLDGERLNEIVKKEMCTNLAALILEHGLMDIEVEHNKYLDTIKTKASIYIIKKSTYIK